jgi:putative polyhydroxyalkanoate system protein
MAKIDIERKHSKPVAEVKAFIDGMMDRMKQMGVDTSWMGDTLNVKGPGVKGTVNITATNLKIFLDLGMPASLMKGKIEEKILRGLEKLG